MQVGCFLPCEEFGPRDLVEQATRARGRQRRGAQRAHPRRHWPEADLRLEMLREAVEVMRTLWEGGVPLGGRSRPCARRHQGLLHGRRGRGAPHRARAVAQRGASGRARPDPPDAVALRAGVRTRSSPRPALPPMGPDLDAHTATLQEYADAGVDELFVQQIGPEQDAFFTTWADEILSPFSKKLDAIRTTRRRLDAAVSDPPRSRGATARAPRACRPRCPGTRRIACRPRCRRWRA